ncbi:MAG: hypothetical protein JO263_00620, partial [Candidatus Eremiobacteraeota bacterium]|nr:hypothetical protein [Candidatus Eremiobacteraeota bacterium]
MKFHSFALSLACALALPAVPVVASVGQSFVFTVARAPRPLPLDPILTDPGWAAGLVPPGNGPWQNVTTRSPSRFATTAYLLYDDKNLYVAFKAE